MDASTTKGSTTDRLIAAISPIVSPLGYEIVYLEVQASRQKILRIFIDRNQPATDAAIGIQDCVAVSKALEEPLEKLPELDAMFPGGYELEVSSPGVDRPLRTQRDFERFAGQEVRIHVYRPLTPDEIENGEYLSKNPRQKNFLGKLLGIRRGKVLLALEREEKMTSRGNRGENMLKKEKKNLETKVAVELSIPLPLISKANLEPKFEL